MAVFALDKYSTACACAREKCSDDCSFYREYKQKLKPITNYDRLRAMSVEEMAKWIMIIEPTACPFRDDHGDDCPFSLCKDCWLDWLKQEVSS